jgi:O-methyltransferase
MSKALDQYVDLMIRCVANTIYKDPSNMSVLRGRAAYSEHERTLGRDWPSIAHTMIGVKRLRSLADQVIDVVKNDIPGDFIETGVWRGGACALVRGIFNAMEAAERKVYVADSFEGLPAPSPDVYPDDLGMQFHTYEPLSVSEDLVKDTFKAYGLLADNVVFVKGWFKDTLHLIDAEQFAIVRLDGDMYESTIQAIEALYPKLSVGGYLIVDDYGMIKACRKAIHDYRDAHGIAEEIVNIDNVGVYWQRLV